MIYIIIFILLVGAPLLWAIWTYNSLVSWKNQVKNSWSQIDVQLKRRHDLIPNLVETVKGYSTHEKETLEKVIQARNMAIKAETPGEVGQAENLLSGTLKSLFAVSENYPELKANQNFIRLQEELTSTENKISFSRQFYNDTVTKFNIMIQSFPKNIIAHTFAFKEAELFEIELETQREPVQVKFG